MASANSIARLDELLQSEGFSPLAYSLDGGNANDTLCIAKEAGIWVTYYTERGMRSNEQFFVAEADACAFFIEWIRGTGGTRITDQNNGHDGLRL